MRGKRLVAGASLITMALVTAACGSSEPEPTSPGTTTASGATSAPGATTPAELHKIVWPSYGTGVSTLLGKYIELENLDEKYGIEWSNKPYDSLQVYYTELGTGAVQIEYGTPDAYASQAAQGVPIKILATMTPWTGRLLVKKEPAWGGASSLTGKRLAMMMSSGQYRLMSTVWAELDGVDLTKVDMIDVPNSAAGAAQVVAGSADATMAWEPITTSILLKNPTLTTAMDDLGEQYKKGTGHDLWHNVIVIREDSDIPADVQVKLVELLKEAADQVLADPSKADEVGQAVGVPEGTYKESIESGRLKFDIRPIDQTISDDIKATVEFTMKSQPGSFEKIPNTYWGTK